MFVNILSYFADICNSDVLNLVLTQNGVRGLGISQSRSPKYPLPLVAYFGSSLRLTYRHFFLLISRKNGVRAYKNVMQFCITPHHFILYSTANMSSASAAISSSTYATALPMPKLPFSFVICVTSLKLSPGHTFFLNLAFLIPPK